VRGATVFKRNASMLAFAVVAWTSLAAPAWSQSEATQVLVTPRFWYAFISSADRVATGASVLHTPIPLYGGTIAVVPKGMGGTTFSLTALYGSGSGDYQEGDSTCCLYRGTNDLSRLDIEGVAQFPIGAAGAYWSLGARYVKTDSDSFGQDNHGSPTVHDPFRFVAHGNYYLGEVGVGGSIRLDAKANHRFFGGLTFVAGQRDVDAWGVCCQSSGGSSESGSFGVAVAGIDTNFGYAVSLGSQSTFFARYRVFALTELHRFSSPESLSIVHGPELNLTFKLN
jgi:hypothetical protein